MSSAVSGVSQKKLARWEDSVDRKDDRLDLYRRTGPGTLVIQTVLPHTQGHFSLVGDDLFTDITLSISQSYPFVYQDQGPEGLAGGMPGALRTPRRVSGPARPDPGSGPARCHVERAP